MGLDTTGIINKDEISLQGISLDEPLEVDGWELSLLKSSKV